MTTYNIYLSTMVTNRLDYLTCTWYSILQVEMIKHKLAVVILMRRTSQMRMKSHTL